MKRTLRVGGRRWHFVQDENGMADNYYWQSGSGLGIGLFVILFWRGGKPAWLWRRYAEGWQNSAHKTRRAAMLAATRAAKEKR